MPMDGYTFKNNIHVLKNHIVFLSAGGLYMPVI